MKKTQWPPTVGSTPWREAGGTIHLSSQAPFLPAAFPAQQPPQPPLLLLPIIRVSPLGAVAAELASPTETVQCACPQPTQAVPSTTPGPRDKAGGVLRYAEEGRAPLGDATRKASRKRWTEERAGAGDGIQVGRPKMQEAETRPCRRAVRFGWLEWPWC